MLTAQSPLRRHLGRSLATGLVLVLLLGMVGCSRETDPGAPETTLPNGTEASGDAAKARTDTFVLRAYDMDAVYVASSHNGWVDEDPAWQLNLQGDGYTWRLIKEVEGMIQYKFVLHKDDEVLWLTDPEAPEISSNGQGDPAYWNAVRGRTFTEPAPLPYTIDRSRLVIYEIALNDFSSTGTFAGAVAGLTSGADLQDLGVNAVELLPVTAPSYNGWGYDPVLYCAPNPAFGWPSTFAILVDNAHDRGMAVILDMVLNHMAGSNPLRQLDEFTGTYHFTTTESNPWGLVELNWSDPATRDYLLESMIHWVETYHVDGYRFDYVAGESYSHWSWLKNELKARFPDLLLIAEDFAYPSDGNAVTYGYDAQWGGNHTDGWGGGGNNFNQVMITALTENGFASRGQTSAEVGAFGPSYNNMWAVANVVSANSQYAGSVPGDGFSDVKYLESHDENRLVWAVETMGSTGAQTVGGVQKAHLGAVISLTSVGIPMLFNGQEIGSGEYRPADPTIYEVDWAGGDTGLRTAYRHLIDLRLTHDALATEHIFFHWRSGSLDQTEYTLTYWRGSTDVSSAAEVVVAANFDHGDHAWTIPFPSAGAWIRHHPADGAVETVSVPAGSLTLTVPASTALLWTKADGSTSVIE